MKTKTALGIDISNGQINMTLLRRGDNGVELVKAARCAVPEGAIVDGNVANPMLLANTIKKFRAEQRMRADNTAVTLVAKPVLMHIMYTPKQIPVNMGQFVRNEIKNYSVLPDKNIISDFCRIGGDENSQSSKLFIVAAEEQKVSEFAMACNWAGLAVDVYEPPLFAYTRAIYAKKIARKFDCNVLLVIVQDGNLTLCVFRNQTIDFVRTKEIGSEITQSNICKLLADEIKTLVQFYDIEVSGGSKEWEITVVYNNSLMLTGGDEVFLQKEVGNKNLVLRTAEDAFKDTFAGEVGSEQGGISSAAIGLAMRFLSTRGDNLKINLLPPKVTKIKFAKRDSLIAANVAAAAVFLLILIAAGLNSITKTAGAETVYKKQIQLSDRLKTLVKQQETLDSQIKSLSGNLDRSSGIHSSNSELCWHQFLTDVKNNTPKTVCITNLYNNGDRKVRLDGRAISYEAVDLFVNMLNKSKSIAGVSVIETAKDNDDNGLIRYSINCLLSL